MVTFLAGATLSGWLVEPAKENLTIAGFNLIAPYIELEKKYQVSVQAKGDGINILLLALSGRKYTECARVTVTSPTATTQKAVLTSKVLPNTAFNSITVGVVNSLRQSTNTPNSGKQTFIYTINRNKNSSSLTKMNKVSFQANISWIPVTPDRYLLIELDAGGNVLSAIGGG